ncbi:hypothetical protein O6H91_08G011900 [Diphasiastrum complanatum]|uniref:Uncharacterized protein n=1 Tax=Diphasiastrum complanatum TaxID=34168 RepID=A0ACC2CV82_DIPCM|nr:hypothetical protein O6H91_08G011900 [Diphasiastrum complanatum]
MANLNCQKPRSFRAFIIAKYMQDDSTPCEIQKGIYLGSIGAACNKVALQSLNITHVLAVAYNVEIPFPNDFKNKNIEVLDSPDVDLQQHFGVCFDFIDEARRQGGGILIHCFAGRSRSVAVLVAYLMRTYEMALSQALELVKLKRPKASPNIGFLRQLQTFECQLACAKIARSEHSLAMER